MNVFNFLYGPMASVVLKTNRCSVPAIQDVCSFVVVFFSCLFVFVLDTRTASPKGIFNQFPTEEYRVPL